MRNRIRIKLVVALAAAVALGAGMAASPAGAATRAQATPFDGTGMWIWLMNRSNSGSVGSIGAQARRHGVRAVYVKASDDRFFWRQFTPQLVRALKAQGLRVCAWQYVYGDRPVTEANLGARAVSYGADCLIIDAEAEYEGKYAQADTYIRTLRAQIGPNFPLGVAPFPYVDYHPAYPYSVFLGPGAAQYNLPQMYWKAIGTSVDNVFSHTYTFNKIYKRQIFPLGQSYDRPRPSHLVRFRQNARAYGAAGVNWWVWQFTTPALWRAIGQPLPTAPLRRRDGWPFLRRNHRSDMVVWAQQHLNGAGHPVAVDGYFGNGTRNAVLAFQAARGLRQTGVIDAVTWQRLLAFQPVYVAWRNRPRPRVRAASASARSGRNGPVSATLPARAREIPAKPRGRG